MCQPKQPLKILSIGNSFSQDAHRWLHALALSRGVSMETANLFIGGCGLQTHWENATHDRVAYDLERNGGEKEDTVSIRQALAMEDWDVVTLQQASHFSGLWETYEPYLSELADLVRKECPGAKLYFHQTWAYETDSRHPGFAAYENNQRKMFQKILEASHKAAELAEAKLIPVGQVIQWLRENLPEFDYAKGGRTLCRDGYHLSFDYGRYAAAVTWYLTVTDQASLPVEFENFDRDLLQAIHQAAGFVCGVRQ